MAYNQEIGTADLRAQFVDSTVKGFAERMYKFKQALTITSTSAWKNVFFRENSNPLTSAGGLSTKVPRGAQPAQGSVKWERVNSYVEKFFYEDTIFFEDLLTDELPVQARTLFRVAEKITKDVDDACWAVLAENPSATATHTNTAIQQVNIAAGKHWSGSSAAIIDDLMNAKTLLASSNYDVSNLIAFINPRDHRSIVNYLATRGAQFPTIGADMATNGRVGEIAGIKLVLSNSVTASYALVCVPKICATWKEAVSFRTTTIEDPYVSLKIRATEEGITQLTDPNAVCLIANTRGDDT